MSLFQKAKSKLGFSNKQNKESKKSPLERKKTRAVVASGLASARIFATEGQPLVLTPALLAKELEYRPNLEFTNKVGWTALMLTAHRGNDPCIELLLAAGALPNTEDPDRNTALSWASSSGHTRCVALLLEAGAKVSPQNKEGRTPLMYSSFHNHMDIVRMLVYAGANVNLIDSHGRTALHFACQKGHVGVVSILVGADTRLEAKHEDDRTLFLNSEKEISKSINMLPDSIADINMKDDAGHTALHVSCFYSHPSCAQVVIDAGVHIEGTTTKQKMTALMVAAARGCHESLQILLDNNACVDAQDIAKRSALHLAVINQELHCAELLIAANASIDLRDEEGDTALCLAVRTGDALALKMLIDAKSNVDLADVENNSPLYHAVGKGYYQIVDILLKAGANVNAVDHHQVTPLLFAALRSKVKCAKLLIDGQADVNMQDTTGCTPLHCAVCHEPSEIVHMLLKAGAQVDTQLYESEMTPLMFAAQENMLVALKMLIEYRANVNLKNDIGHTAIYIASSKGHGDCVAALLDAKAMISSPQMARSEFDLLLEEDLDSDDNSEDRKDIEALDNILTAARRGDTETVKILLEEKNANVQMTDASGRTALHHASYQGHEACVVALMEAKGSLETRDKYDSSALMWAASYNNHKAVRLLIKMKANINVQDYAGRTALHRAVRGMQDDMKVQSSPDCVKLLLAAGGDVNILTKKGLSPLCSALLCGNIDCAVLLVEAGADLWEEQDDVDGYVNGFGQNPISIAMRMLDQLQGARHEALLGILLKASRQQDKLSALSYAASHCRADWIRMLLDGKADVMSVTKDGKTALDIAKEAVRHVGRDDLFWDQTTVIELLKQHMPADAIIEDEEVDRKVSDEQKRDDDDDNVVTQDDEAKQADHSDDSEHVEANTVVADEENVPSSEEGKANLEQTTVSGDSDHVEANTVDITADDVNVLSSEEDNDHIEEDAPSDIHQEEDDIVRIHI